MVGLMLKTIGFRWKRLLAAWLAALLAVSLLPPYAASPVQVAAASGNSCLTLIGTLKENNESVFMFRPITFEYTILPQGELIDMVRDPVDVAMVLDVSLSMSYPMESKPKPTRMDTLKDAATAFLDDLAAQNAGDRVGLVKFSTLASQVRGLTTNYAALKQDIQKFSPNGNTNIEDGLRIGLDMLTDGERQKYVILLTDGYATHYRHRNSAVYNNAEARKRALQRADQLAAAGVTVYAIGLGTPGSTDVDHELLEQIAAKTGGAKFSASNTNELIQVFREITQAIQREGKISGIEIRQPVPPGFEAVEGSYPGARVENGVLIVPIPDIHYPFEFEELKVSVQLMQTAKTGEYEFEDAVLKFRDACDRESSTIIPNNNRITVSGWVDVWGNVYVGDSNGAVIRYRHGDFDEKQFVVPGPGNGDMVSNITFEDSAQGVDDDAFVNVTYENGSMPERLNLLPIAPQIRLFDEQGNLIEEGWHQGPIRVEISGSGHRLPSGTSFSGANNDFQSGYITGYEYRIDGGAWQPYPGHPVVVDEEFGQIEARAVTISVSGRQDKPSYGDVATRYVQLDNTPPEIAFEGPTDGKVIPDNDPKLKITVRDMESTIDSVTLILEDQEGRKYERTFAGNGANTVSEELRLSSLVPEAKDRVGWFKVTVTARNAAGASHTITSGFVVNPGPGGTLAAKEGDKVVDYSVKASNKPVTVHLTTNKTIVAKRSDVPGSYDIELKEISVRIAKEPGEGTFVKLGAYQFQVTEQGTNYITVKLTDTKGNVTFLDLVVKIDYNQKRF